MIELIKTIAMLCTISSGQAQVAQLKFEQLSCQQYYVKCIFGEHQQPALTNYYDELLNKCILERKM